MGYLNYYLYAVWSFVSSIYYLLKKTKHFNEMHKATVHVPLKFTNSSLVSDKPAEMHFNTVYAGRPIPKNVIIIFQTH